jgi:hypothetical protein
LSLLVSNLRCREHRPHSVNVQPQLPTIHDNDEDHTCRSCDQGCRPQRTACRCACAAGRL